MLCILKNICSECLFSNVHNSHNYKEKYDYLQSGQELVSQLFKNLNVNIKDGDAPFTLQLKDKIFKFNSLVNEKNGGRDRKKASRSS